MKPIVYFAYGSNLHPARLRARVESARALGVGRLPRHDFRFHKASDRDGSGKGDAWYTGRPEDVVHGVLWEIAVDEKALLDEIEGVGAGYDVHDVEIVTDSGVRAAYTYLAQDDHIDPQRRPFEWYKAFVVEGAKAHGLPSAYVEKIEAMEADRDPNEERALMNREILSSSE